MLYMGSKIFHNTTFKFNYVTKTGHQIQLPQVQLAENYLIKL